VKVTQERRGVQGRHPQAPPRCERDDRLPQNDGDVSADDADRAKKKVEEMVAEVIKHVDAVIASKEKDIMEV
jgi:ribosome recycling factor